MPIPSPKERPDLYDDYDGRPEGSVQPGEKEYWDKVVPDHIKQALAAKRGKQSPSPKAEPYEDDGKNA